jgi:WD40 repeat protein
MACERIRRTAIGLALVGLASACGGGSATAPVVPAPTISSVSPASGPTAGGTQVTLTGTGFDTASGKTTVIIGGAAATAVSVSSSTTLTCAAPAGAAGTADVAVSTSGGSATLKQGFTYVDASLVPYLFAALLSDRSAMCSGTPPPSSRVEIVDLRTNLLAGGFILPGTAAITSLAVSPDGQRVFLANPCTNQVHVYTPRGAKVTDLAIAGPRDLSLSADGSTLYVATFTGIVAFETATHAQTGNVAFDASDAALGLALSPDEATLAVASTNGAGPAVYLFSTSPLAVIQRVPITATIPGCAVMPNDVTFTESGRVLAWDSNCDWLYQVDVATRSYLSASSVAYARDSGSSVNYNNSVFYVPATGKAYGFNEAYPQAQATVSDPAAASGRTLGGFASHVVGAPAPLPDGSGVYYSVINRYSGGGADTLDLLDTGTETFARGIYTFSDPTRSVREMRVVRIPAL